MEENIMNIKELKEKYQNKEWELRRLKRKIIEIDEKKIIPMLKKQYEGKYFKFRNNFSCPEKPSDYWFIFYRVDEVISPDFCYTTAFQTDKYGVITIERKKQNHLNLLTIEITKKEFNNEYNKMFRKIKAIK
jgi:hypothetical protein